MTNTYNTGANTELPGKINESSRVHRFTNEMKHDANNM
jgi:hypothetical protein